MIPTPRQESGAEPADPGTGGRRRPSVGLILAAVAIAGAIVAVGFALAPYFQRARIEGWVRGAGAWGPFVLLAVQALQILIAPIPGFFVPVLAGLFYGPVVGPLITMAGSLLGSGAAFWIGRSGGRPVAERLVGAEAVQKAQNLFAGKRWIALVPLFLIPFSPADGLCFVAGIIGMDAKRFLLAVALGRLPKDALIAAGTALGWSFFRP
ncbi:MAG TPA: VTT domain-containing protein [Candidatus Eisenbacteria bacterium]|nr:VTT domain-containing protein [Candidatus Eisenbacteria bacterium]